MKTRTRTVKLSENYMDFVFVKNPQIQWRVKENSLVEIDMENRGFFNFLAQKFFQRPKISHISLDKYGTTLWLAMDGEAAVSGILKTMKGAFPAETDKMLNRVVQFLNTLEGYNFIERKKMNATPQSSE